MATSFTQKQLSAIETRDKTLLVSAGAGAGKTATLTERITRQILDDSKPMDISRMLIVTFTKAAAAELRERIGKALKRATVENKGNKHLATQLHLLPSAKISTIDSFCNDIFKNNAERFGISPKYRILDPTEGAILSRNLLSALIGEIYDNNAEDVATPLELSLLSDSLSGVKTETNVEDIFLKLYRDSQSLEDGVEIFAKYRDMMKESAESPLSSKQVGYAVDSTKNSISLYIDIYNSLYPEIEREAADSFSDKEGDSSDDKKGKAPLSEKFLLVMKSDEALFKKITEAKSYGEIKELLEIKLPSSPTVKNELETPLLLRLKELRKNMRDGLQDIYGKFFKWDEEGYRAAFLALSRFTDILYRILKKFDVVFFEEKKRRAALEYSDIEKLAYLSLYNEDGSYTDFAYAERELYDAVYIDEYQDVNELQNKIFEAVSTPCNRFMVGDIKQSIYGFRGASPDIFRELKKSFPPLEETLVSDTATVFMSQNFRCDRGIIDFVNTVFDRLFTIASDSIGYVSEDRLEFAKHKKEDEPAYRKPVLKIFTGEDIPEDNPELASEISALFIAGKIKELLKHGTLADKSPITPSDIAILLRKDSGKIDIYKRALLREGIPTSTDGDKTFFDNSDVRLALCLLNSIDNPSKDIYLAGLMLSPLFSFTADELVLIKKCSKASSLWKSLKLYCEENEGFVKGRSFINTINKYRTLAEGMTTDSLILKLYSETGLFSLAMRTGGRENLMRLYNYARSFEGSSYKGLYNFISYVNTAIERGASFSEKKGEAPKGTVTITTMHSSKGLEYPIVFIGEAGGPLLSSMDKRLPFRLHPELGFAINPKSEKINALIESPIYKIIDDAMDLRSIYEELRIIYVAFTRAREQLYVVGKSRKKTRAELDELISSISSSGSLASILSLSSVLELILFAGKDSYEEDSESFTPSIIEYPSDREDGIEKAPDSHEPTDAPLISELLFERLNYEYPDIHLTTLPEKMSISRLHPGVLDGADDTVFDLTEEDGDTRPLTLPEFMEKSKVEQSKRRGIATHKFMQFCDIERLYLSGSKQELSRLYENGFLTEEETLLVRVPEIEKFRESSLLLEMRRAKSIYREFRFNTNLPAHLFTEDKDKKELYKEKTVLLQGVIDCIFEDEDGNLHLVDYKTDRLTKEELADRRLAEKTLGDKHSLQLSYYSVAVEKIFGKTPLTRQVYSLALGDSVYTDNILE